MLTRLLALWARTEIALASLAIATTVVLIVAQILIRLVAPPIVWIEEVGVYLFLWTIFLGAGAAYKKFQHLRIALFDLFGETARRVGPSLANGIVLVVALILLWHAPAAIAIELRSNTTSLPIELPRALFFSIPLVYALASIALTAFAFVIIGVPADAEDGEGI